MFVIRPATLDDAQALARLAEDTFRSTFAAYNTDSDMALHCERSYGPGIQAAEIANPQMHTLVCDAGNQLIGYAQLRFGRAPDCVMVRNPTSKPGEIQRLYVADSWHGKGIAPALMDACLQEMKKRHLDTVWLGVWEHNPRAIRFYQKNGFSAVGDHIFPVGTDPQRDVLMMRPLEHDG